MNSIFRISLFLLFLITLVPHSNADIAQGYVWLADQQQVDGRVYNETSLAHPLQTTVEALLAFDTDISAAGLNRDQALAFIATNAELSTEFIARASLLGIEVGSENNNWVARLITHQNSDGGFGSFAEFNSNTLDTALALTALASVKSEYPSEVRRAVSYILNQQQSNGAYFLYLSDTPSLPLSAFVAATLQSYVFDFNNVAESLANTSQFILDEQAVGVGIESNWQIALSLLAIVPNIRDSALYSNLVDSLADDQLANGSWGNDVYATALAIKALQLAANISFPEEPTTGRLSGRLLDNESGSPISNVSVYLTEDAKFSTTTDEQGRFSLHGVEPGSYTLNHQIAGYSGSTQSVGVAIGQVTDVGDIRLQRIPNTATVSGTVTDAVSGKTLSGSVIMFSGSGSNTSVTLDANGIYTISLTSDTYEFVVSYAGYQPLTGSATLYAGNNIAFSPTLYPENETPPAETTVTLLGVVVDESTNAPIEGASVLVSGVALNTLADGTFRIEGIDAGSLTLTISAQDYSSRQIQLVAPEGGVGDVGSIALMPNEAPLTSSVFGVITNSETGEPILGATVTLEDIGLTTTSLSTGAYSLAEIEPLTFNIFTSAPGYWSQRTTFSLNKVASSRFDIALSPSDLGGFSIDQLTTDQDNYEAYSPAIISASLHNPSDTTKSVKLLLEVFNEKNEVVASIPIGGSAISSEPSAPYIVIPGDLISVSAQWFTRSNPPGKYFTKLSAFDQFTSQVLSEKVSYFQISPTTNIIDANLMASPRYSNVGAEENAQLYLDTINRSNVPVAFSVNYQWVDPQGISFREGSSLVSLDPSETQELILLDKTSFAFDSSGVYTVAAKIESAQLDVTIENVEIRVAPTVRVEASQNISPGLLIPNGEQRVKIEISVQGVEQ